MMNSPTYSTTKQPSCMGCAALTPQPLLGVRKASTSGEFSSSKDLQNKACICHSSMLWEHAACRKMLLPRCKCCNVALCVECMNSWVAVQPSCTATCMQNCMCLSGDARQQDFFGGKLLSTWVLPKLMWHVTYDIADQRMRFRMSAQKLVPLQS